MGSIASVLGSQTSPSLTLHVTLWPPVQPGPCFGVPAWVWSLLLEEAFFKASAAEEKKVGMREDFA